MGLPRSTEFGLVATPVSAPAPAPTKATAAIGPPRIAAAAAPALAPMAAPLSPRSPVDVPQAESASAARSKTTVAGLRTITSEFPTPAAILRRCDAPWKLTRTRLGGFPSTQSLIEIGNEIAEILDTDGETDQGIVDAEGGALCGRQGSMRHDRGMLDQAFDTAQTFGEREDLNTLEKAARLGEAALYLDCHHAAEAVHLSRRERMMGMARETGVVNRSEE